MSSKNLMAEVPCTFHGLHDWSKHMFEKFGWMNVICMNACNPELKEHAMLKIKVYQESITHLGLALENKLSKTTDIDRKNDLMALIKNNNHLEKMAESLNKKMSGGAKKRSKSTKKH